MPKAPTDNSEPWLFPEEGPRSGRPKAPLTRDEAHEAINDLFRRAMKRGNAKQWMTELLRFVVGMRRYSIFTAKLIYAQRPGALAVGTPLYWSRRGRSVRPGAMPIVILVHSRL
jgi:hypothetical protein